MSSPELFSKETRSIVYGYQQNAIQRMLDFDVACGREKPSVAAIVNPSRGGWHKVFFGNKETLLPMYRTIAEAVEIVFDSLINRLWEVPVDPGNYLALAANEEFLFVLDRTGESSDLKSIAIGPEEPEIEVFAENVKEFALSADGENLFYHGEVDEEVTLALVRR